MLRALPTVLQTKKHKFLRDFSKAYTTQNPPSFLPSPKTLLCPQTQASTGPSVTTQVKSPIPARASVILLPQTLLFPPHWALPPFAVGPLLGTLTSFQRRSETHLEFRLPRRPPAGRPNSLFMPTSRKGDISNMWESTKRPKTDKLPEEKGDTEKRRHKLKPNKKNIQTS